MLIGKINTLIWFHGMKKKKSLMEGTRTEGTTRCRGNTLVGTPKAHLSGEFAVVAQNCSCTMPSLASRLFSLV